MLRHRRIVSVDEWRLSAAVASRHARLLDVPSPDVLLDRVLQDSANTARAGTVTLKWQDSEERPGYGRLWAQIPLTETTFDQFFNGRSGYRAQYYLSPEEGILYNRDAVDGLLPVIRAAYDKRPLREEFGLIQHSLEAPHAKLWIFGEQKAFDEAPADALNPPRWVDNGATRGRKAPLPDHLMLDVKGAFINPQTKAMFIDELKLDRARDLFNRGFT
jgi:hypothetical protein